MIGNVALDVVIGLIFVYLLYSLYATILMEMISSFLGLRARNLCYALSRMLMDEKKYRKFTEIKNERTGELIRIERELTKKERIVAQLKTTGLQFITSFTKISGYGANLTNRELYDRFFSQPSIKYLGNGGLTNKPSYLSAESFSKAVIDAIKTDDIEIGLLASFEEGMLQKLPEDSETRQHIQSLLDDANNDLVKFKMLLEQWYTNTMERASGWFKRSTQAILLLIGLILAIVFNVNSITIIKTLSQDKDARNQLVKLAVDFTEKNASAIENIQEQKGNDTTKSVIVLQHRLDSLQLLKASLENDINDTQNILSSAWYITDSLTYYSKAAADTLVLPAQHVLLSHHLDSIGDVMVLIHRSVDQRALRCVLPRHLDEGVLRINTFRYKLRHVFSFPHVWGYLLTVLAISLGAPFWFDLLNKLVKLRSSNAVASNDNGKGPSPDSSSSHRAILNRAG